MHTSKYMTDALIYSDDQSETLTNTWSSGCQYSAPTGTSSCAIPLGCPTYNTPSGCDTNAYEMSCTNLDSKETKRKKAKKQVKIYHIPELKRISAQTVLHSFVTAIMKIKPDVATMNRHFSNVVIDAMRELVELEDKLFFKDRLLLWVTSNQFHPIMIIIKNLELVFDQSFVRELNDDYIYVKYDYETGKFSLQSFKKKEESEEDIESFKETVSFEIGAKYKLINYAIESKKEKIYICKKVLHVYKGEEVDIVIMKCTHAQNDEDIFTLTKNDCKSIGMKYERGLQVFSEFENFERIEVQKDEVKENNKPASNKATYHQQPSFDSDFMANSYINNKMTVLNEDL